jgi:hypothetical protein
MSARIRVNEPRVVHEIIGGEAVIVNLVNGNYYSSDGVGAEVWRLIGSGPTTEDIVAFVVASYDVDQTTASSDVNALLDALEQEDIIVRSEEDDGTPLPRVDALASKIPYATPRVEIYSDMQQMIALDPIHEVDEKGWPSRKT